MSSSPAQSRVFVSSANSSLIYDLNSTRLDQTSPVIQANAVPLSTVADPANDRLYVGTSTGLDVYNASTDKLNATASALTGNCTQLVLDQPDNLLWLANNLAVDAVSLKTLQVLNPTGLLVPVGSTQGIAFDPSDSEIFVLVSPSTVEVLSSSGENPPGPEIDVGANVTSLAYDPSDNQSLRCGRWGDTGERDLPHRRRRTGAARGSPQSAWRGLRTISRGHLHRVRRAASRQTGDGQRPRWVVDVGERGFRGSRFPSVRHRTRSGWSLPGTTPFPAQRWSGSPTRSPGP